MPDSAPAPFGSLSSRRPGTVRQGSAEPGPDETARAPTNAHATVPRLTVIVPTFNERGNVERMFAGIDRALTGIPYEVIFVDDDSPDGTADAARQLGERDPRVRCIRRVGRRGLAGACIEGMISASAPIVAVMDADLQHDEELLPRMLDLVRSGAADIVVGSRYVAGGAAADGFSAIRRWGSNTANALARFVLGAALSDPMSGFFMMRRAAVEEVVHRLSRQGFKILLDIIVSTRPRPTIVELAYSFRERRAGTSKLDSLVALEFIGLVVSKMLGGVVGVRFVLFGLVGLSGVVIHLATLRGLLFAGLGFDLAQLGATATAMTTNFFLNNALTYRDRRLTGLAMLRGLLTFYLVCAVGVVANVGVASVLHGDHRAWWLAGLAGAVVGSVWNYVASAALTWRVR